MREVTRLKVAFVDKETMTKIENTHRVIVQATNDGELLATYYDVDDDYEVEIKVVE